MQFNSNAGFPASHSCHSLTASGHLTRLTRQGAVRLLARPPLLSSVSLSPCAAMSLRTLSSSSKKLSASLGRQAAVRTYATSNSNSNDYTVSSGPSGIKLASIDDGSPTSAITVAVKAGPRYEPAPGLAHVLKNFVFKVIV